MDIRTTLIPTYQQMLGSLDGLLTLAQSDSRGDALLAARLVEDMFPLATQVRFACNMPGEAMGRLTGLEFVSRDEDPATLAEAREWVASRRADLDVWSQRDFAGSEAAIELALPNGMTFDLSAGEYVRDWALPQFYFHINAAYAILRQSGLAIGKANYVGYMFRYIRQPAA